MKYASILLLSFLVLFGCQSQKRPSDPEKFSGREMTIDYNITIGDRFSALKNAEAQSIINQTFHEIDTIYNKWNPSSEISQINASPANTPLTLSPQLNLFLLRIGNLVALSEGRFDPTIEPLQQLWIKKLEAGQVPTLQEINDIKPCIGWQTLHFSNGAITKEDSRTQIDLGGSAKGYCVDLLIERLQSAGFNNLFVEWGGEIRTLGKHPSGRPWHVYISRLNDPNPDVALVHLELSNHALATSGDYFQFWSIQDHEGMKKTYCHIFNPLTLSPLEIKTGSIASASLLARDCTTADCLAKVLMLFETAQEAREWVEKIQTEYPELACWLATRKE